jgi:phage gp45-like
MSGSIDVIAQLHARVRALESANDRLYRRILMHTAWVTISATNDTGPVHLIQGRVRGTPETIDNLQTLNLYGFASHAPTGSDALAMFGNGDRSNGVIVATANQAARPRNQPMGEVSLHDDKGNIITLHQDGTIEIVCSTKVRMVTPRLEVTGDIIDHCDSQSHTDADMREIYNTHTHGGVQEGGSNTGVPNQLQRTGDDVD